MYLSIIWINMASYRNIRFHAWFIAQNSLLDNNKTESHIHTRRYDTESLFKRA